MTAISGQAIYFDGVTSASHDVTVTLGPTALDVRTAGGDILAEWPYQEIEAVSSPDGLLRVGRIGNPVLARLDVRDPALATAIDDLSQPIDRSGLTERRGRRKVIFWSIAATVSLVLMAIFGVPELATRLTPYVPYDMERRLGLLVDSQVRGMLDTEKAGERFECGNDPREKAGRAAFDKLFAPLDAAAEHPNPLRMRVVRSKDVNAIALPGGLMYVFYGLIEKSESPDELAGVVAHEIGHVAHRDGTRTVLQGAGMTFLFGMLLGDFVGGGAVILASKAILQSRYSREVEASADAYSVNLMSKVGGDPRALGTILTRIAGGIHGSVKILLDHPETKDRVAAINAMAPPTAVRPLIDKAEWAEIKRMCAPLKAE
jgi:Zn-dependent protease with chaperone function